ncbi:cellulase family glycosylhydrolase [Falsiroseomonas oryziterrae]|uniref:cellulase family glycosylhydrolase n=1 Tax=Falsiroseomonas oryziterrae TaxID=2911368 RepID=UPI001F243B1E|nr:cellulase family glycosylhydrolase [Roseomonas sp. NPKOSM-4]
MDRHVGRRALLATCAAAAAVPAAAQAPDPRATFAALRVGANVERWFPVAADGHARRLGRGWWEGLRGAGFDHVRMFMPRDAGTGEDVLRLYLTAVEDAVAAGLPVLFAFNDAYGSTDPWPEPLLRAVAARARLFGRATDPARVVLAPVNEPAFPNAAEWTPVRNRLLAMVRAEAPRHVLMWGGHEWCSWRSLLQQPAAPDPLTIAEVHDYEGGDAAWFRERFGQVAEWGRRHRTPVMVTELGGRLGHQEDEAAWAADLRRGLPELRRLGLPATLWAVTHGGHWRLQQGAGPALRPLLAAAIRA